MCQHYRGGVGGVILRERRPEGTISGAACLRLGSIQKCPAHVPRPPMNKENLLLKRKHPFISK